MCLLVPVAARYYVLFARPLTSQLCLSWLLYATPQQRGSNTSSGSGGSTSGMRGARRRGSNTVSLASGGAAASTGVQRNRAVGGSSAANSSVEPRRGKKWSRLFRQATSLGSAQGSATATATATATASAAAAATAALQQRRVSYGSELSEDARYVILSKDH
jgi:hypothetical protein